MLLVLLVLHAVFPVCVLFLIVDLHHFPEVPHKEQLIHNLTLNGVPQAFVYLSFSSDMHSLLVSWKNTPSERSEEHTSELQSRENLVCRLLREKRKIPGRHFQLDAKAL